MYFKAGTAVRVNKDITRVAKWNWDNTGEYPKSLPVEHTYARAGETGVVTEIFRPEYGSQALYAKVKIQDEIKTFRLSSLDTLPTTKR